MDKAKLVDTIRAKGSFLCVGLDPDLEKIPAHLRSADDPFFEFSKAIIDATRDYCVAYKPNTAFFEALGPKGWLSLQKVVEYIGRDHLTIADAKRGDIGNTSTQYARAFFEAMPFDALTVAPYMGSDSVKPFMAYPGKWVVLLALTSNPGAEDFQFHSTSGHENLFEVVIEKACTWGSEENLMFVVGATRPEMIGKVRALAPHHFFLVPGFGAQGGSLKEVVRYGLTSDVGLLLNSSRSIIYASSGVDFAEAAGREAKAIALDMRALLAQNT